jgi:anti-sigma28 factor (negative regulator of flagellin synthesis)
MKINDNHIGGACAGDTQRIQDIQNTDLPGTGGTGAATAREGDRVELSGTLGRLSQALTSFQSGRSARIDSLAVEYQRGTYQVDSPAISRGLVSESLSVGLQ